MIDPRVAYLARDLADQTGPAFDRHRRRLIALHRELSDDPSREALLALYVMCCEREQARLIKAQQPVAHLVRHREADMRDFCLTEASAGRLSVAPLELARVVERELAAGRMAPSRFTALAEAGANVFGHTIHQPITPNFLNRLFAVR